MECFSATIGNRSNENVRELFEGRHWYELKPDFASSQDDFVVGGSSNWNDEDDLNFIARARTSDGKTAMAYIPNSCGTSSNCPAVRQVVVAMTKLGAATPDRQAFSIDPAFETVCIVEVAGQKAPRAGLKGETPLQCARSC